MMLGGVPINVMRPPRMVANESGMRSIAGENFARAADCTAMGMRSASAPTLFMMADRAPPMLPK